MPLVEQDLIQVMLADERLVKLPEDLENSAFRSNAGRSIYGAIRKIAGSDEHISSAAVRDMLDDQRSCGISGHDRTTAWPADANRRSSTTA